MLTTQLDRLLESAVADALGVTLPPVSKLHHRARGKPHRSYPRKPVNRPLVISARYHRVADQAHA